MGDQTQITVLSRHERQTTVPDQYGVTVTELPGLKEPSFAVKLQLLDLC